MLRVILNRLANHAEQILEEEQAAFRSQRSTTDIQVKAAGNKMEEITYNY